VQKTTILIIEDDEEIARLTAMHLKRNGYLTDIVTDGADAIASIKQRMPDLILLDLMLPNVSGNVICKQARVFYNGPILVMTASNDDINEVSLLELGADDYLRKPVKPQILSLRIAALLRRCITVNNQKITLNSIEIDCLNHKVNYQDKVINLTNSEFDMLAVLAKNAGQIVSREACCKSLRGIDYDLSDRSIDMRVSALRKKLKEETGQAQLIKTVRNKGYILINE